MTPINNEATPRSWTTASEIDFIDQMLRGTDALTKLRGYLGGMSRRADFGSINTSEVLFYAREKLELLERRSAR